MFNKIILFTFCILIFTSCDKNAYRKGLTINKIENEIIFTTDGRQIPVKPEGYENATIIALARHAETVPGQENPTLSEQGLARADTLAAILLPLNIQEVFLTTFKRTIVTARPLARPNNIKVSSYKPDDYEKMTTRILDNLSGKAVAIYGHSNTTPAVINLLIGKDKYSDISHDEYDNLYLVLHNGKNAKGKTDALVYQFKY